MPQTFAIVPAAGRSVRMGRPKLLLPWQASTVIETVLSAWCASRATRVVVVVRPDDPDLARVCGKFDIDLVVADEPPPEMKDSVRLGLDHISACRLPAKEDYWLLAPADVPRLSTASIDRVIACLTDNAPDAPVVPTHQGRRGHPVAFPWRLATVVRDIPAGMGINWLLKGRPIVECAAQADAVAADLDTWDDYVSSCEGATRDRSAPNNL